MALKIVLVLSCVGLALGLNPYAPAPYHPAPAPYHPAPYHPAPKPYHPAPAYVPKPHPHDPYKIAPRPFAYEYGVNDEYSGASFGQNENQDEYGVVTGQYRVLLPDGRTQIVTYTADHEHGYVADVQYEGEAHYEPYVPKPAPYHPKPAPYHLPKPAPAPYHPAPAYVPKPAPYHPSPAPYHPAPYHPKPAPYHPAPVYHPSPAPYHL